MGLSFLNKKSWHPSTVQVECALTVECGTGVAGWTTRKRTDQKGAGKREKTQIRSITWTPEIGPGRSRIDPRFSQNTTGMDVLESKQWTQDQLNLRLLIGEANWREEWDRPDYQRKHSQWRLWKLHSTARRPSAGDKVEITDRMS